MAISKLPTGAILDNSITNAKIADDAIGVADLAATGTPSTTTFLRGDNAWATPIGGVTSVNGVTGAITAAHIATAVEAASGSNTFTDADHTKLSNIEGSATADQTNSEIKTAVEAATSIALGGSPTTTTQAESDNTTKLATTAYVTAKITTLIGGAPSTLNDLNELALAINDDANYNSTLTTALATKLPKAGGTMTGTVISPSFTSTAGGTFTTASGNDVNIVYPDGRSLFIKEAGTTHVTVDNAGQVGIGKSPIRALDIKATGDPGIRLESASQSMDVLTLRNSDGRLGIGGDVITVRNSKVGIGTVTPAAQLQVKNTVTTADGTIYFPLSVGGQNHVANYGVGIGLDPEGSGNRNKIGIVAEGNAAGYSRGKLHFVLDSANDAGQATLAETKMTILDSGNVGIGTAAPSFENGTGLEIRYAGGNGAHLKLTDNASGAGGTNGFDLYAYNNNAYVENYETGSLVFRNNGDERMRIAANGYVGIGTTNDGHVLNVDSKEVDDAYTPTNYNDKGQISIVAKNTENNYVGINFSHDGGTEGFLGFVRRSSTSDIAEFVFQGYDGSANQYKEYMRIDHGGRVTIPNQPAFDAHSTSNAYSSGTSVSSLNLNATRLNVGGHYNTSNDRFTAPVAGVYQFNYRTIVNGAASNAHVRMQKNGSIIDGTDSHYSASSGTAWSTWTYSALVLLAANDYVEVFHTVAASIHGNDYQSFNGHLIG